MSIASVGKLLECFMRQKNFQINKIVISIYKLETCRRNDLTALALIVQGCWIEGVHSSPPAPPRTASTPTTPPPNAPINAREHFNPELASYEPFEHSVPPI